MDEERRIVVLGAMTEMPVAGVVWQVLHYLEGLRRLGHDVCYIEDTGSWPYDPELETVTDDPAPAATWLGRTMEGAGFAQRWAFVSAAREHETWGMTHEHMLDVLSRTDALINLSGHTILKDAHLEVPVRIYLETDPVTPQLEISMGRKHTIELLAAHTHHFSFGERLGLPGCTVPVERFTFRPTRQPVVLDWWPPPPGFPQPPAGGVRFTTVANWEQTYKDLVYAGETYTWTKSAEFLKLLDVPRRAGVAVELALALDDAPTAALLERSGFSVVRAGPLSRDPDAYRAFITASGAEFTAAKDQNVRLRSGWFSDRTATYLATGRPTVVQDTGFDVSLPTGEGLLPFRTADGAVECLQRVVSDYERHSRAAHEIAVEHFRAETVLERLLCEAGIA
ncbi:MAG TPA: hypothetical protein VG294_18800 [Solirubrobacteraceae bacterium]|nr:hypothetical protein [Solirubrobacteraceae bacterium]